MQNCFLQTAWAIFKTAASYDDHIDTEEYVDTVSSYIAKCPQMHVTVMKIFTARGNQKPWMTSGVRLLLKAHDTAFRTGDSNALRSARTALTQEIRKVKKAYVSMIHGYFSDPWILQRHPDGCGREFKL